jgi:hypothetical protein
MPPRDPELPEGTDAIVSGAAADDTSGSGTGFVARGGGTDRLVSQVRDQVGNLRGQATERLRGYADDGKSKATDLLEEMAGVIDDAARSIDQRLGEEYGEYAHRASGAVADFAGRIRGKSVDDLVDDTRDFVRKSPTRADAGRPHRPRGSRRPPAHRRPQRRQRQRQERPPRHPQRRHVDRRRGLIVGRAGVGPSRGIDRRPGRPPGR